MHALPVASLSRLHSLLSCFFDNELQAFWPSSNAFSHTVFFALKSSWEYSSHGAAGGGGEGGGSEGDDGGGGEGGGGEGGGSEGSGSGKGKR